LHLMNFVYLVVLLEHDVAKIILPLHFVLHVVRLWRLGASVQKMNPLIGVMLSRQSFEHRA
jgi:hypothetical protein